MTLLKNTGETLLRDIVAIDESLCNGCGLCLPACAEGALTLENGKVKIVADKLCDGLGACLGVCPRGALRLEKRETVAFDASAVDHSVSSASASEKLAEKHSGPPSQRHWPLKLQLTPVNKDFLRGVRLVLAADCAPAACPRFADRYLPGKVLLITCPKLEDKESIVERLVQLFTQNPPQDLTLIRMEVPCCCLPELVQRAQERAGTSIPCRTSVLTRYGQENLPGFGRRRA